MDKQISLTKDQINQLFEFTKKKYVKHEDVKFEIVDHLASDIEAQMSEDPDIDFETALKITYSKFPITGFYRFVEEKTSALQRYWRRKLFSTFLSYFKLPKLILTVLIAVTFYFLKSNFPSFPIHYITGSLLLVYLTITLRKLGTDYKVMNYLFINTYKGCIYSILMLAIYYNFYVGGNFMSGRLYLDTILFTLSIIVLLAVSSGETRQVLEDEIEIKYKHLGIAEIG